MKTMQWGALFCAGVLLSGCGKPQEAVDEALLAEIDGIKAVDNHAHPVRATHAGEAPDRDFDALPVDNMEPQSDPVNLRPDAPAVLDAQHALFAAQTKVSLMQS